MIDYKKRFIKDFTQALQTETASVFLGAGISKENGLVNWKDLVRNLGNEIGLNVDKENDLISVLQYYKNRSGNANIICNEITEKLLGGNKGSSLLDCITKLPIKSYWTTNYDDLLVDCLSKRNNRNYIDVKICNEDFTKIIPNRITTIYKIHGDISRPYEAIITKDDYERFEQTHQAFITALKGELVSKTFAFIGYSFRDPDFEHILSSIRVLLESHVKTHYCFMRRINMENYRDKNGAFNSEDYSYDLNKQELRIEDLKRYGIQTILVDDYSELKHIFDIINRKYLMNRIFISGSARKYGTFQNNELFLHDLGYQLVKSHFKVASGFVQGVGPEIINGVLDAITEDKLPLEEYMQIKHLPSINGDNSYMLAETKQYYQNNMIEEAGIVLFLYGNNYYDGILSNSKGVLKEFRKAKELNRIIIPIASTGFAAKQILEEIETENAKTGAFSYLKPYFNLLKTISDPNKIVSLVNQIIGNLDQEI